MFGQALAMHRRVAGLTQEDLSALSGVSVRTIQALESGSSRNAQHSTALLLADALRLGPDDQQWFLSGARRRRSGVARGVDGGSGILDADPILGRDVEIAAIEQEFARGARLLTLLGPGGVGKTRLARVIAARRVASKSGVTVWADLETLQAPEDVLPGIARALEIPEIGDQPLFDRIADMLDLPRTLLVLDNFEHLPGAAPHVAALLAAAPALDILVTTREALRLAGEKALLIDPLILPRRSDAPIALAANPAVALFMRSRAAATPARAAAAERHGSDGDGGRMSRDLDQAAEIVQRLDGLPLAIELAAAQGAVMPLATIVALLESSGLAALARGRRDGPGRFATMDAAVGWSVDLLPPDAQRLFRLLGVFRGGFTTEAIAGVAAVAGAPILVASLPLLAESQLIQPDPATPQARFRMLEPVRMVAVARLRDNGEEPAARRAHAAWVHRWARKQARVVAGPDPLSALDALDADLPNIRAAIAASAEPAIGDTSDALLTITALSQFWEVRGRFREGRAALTEALAAAGPDAPRTTPLLDAIFWSGYLPYLQSDVPAMDAAVARLRPLAEADGTPEYAVRALILDVLRRDAAGAPCADLLPVARAAHALMADQPREVSWQQSLVILANLHVQCGDYESALPLLRDYEDWANARESLLHVIAAKDWLGFALLRLARADEARALFGESLSRNLRLGSVGTTPNALLGYALSITQPGATKDDLERGAMLLGALDWLIEQHGYPIGEVEASAMASARARISATLGEPRFADLLAAGAKRFPDDLASLVTH